MDNTHVKVIDSPPGSGKTSYIIDYIKTLPEDQKVIYITPFLDECDRIQAELPKRNFVQPDRKMGGGRKMNHFLKLIENEENIASTHSLFSEIDDDVIYSLKIRNYILVLDEAFQVLNKFDMWKESGSLSQKDKDNKTKNNVQTLLNKSFIEVDNEYKVKWIDNDNPLDKYYIVKKLADRGLLFLIGNNLLLWSFPVEIFEDGIFDEVYILTYQFEYQLQSYYYKYFNVQYEMFHIEGERNDYKMIKTINHKYEKEWKHFIKEHLHIEDNPRLNKVGDPYSRLTSLKASEQYYTTLSKTWYIKKDTEGKLINKVAIDKIIKNIVNFFTNIHHSKASERMWTCFKEDPKIAVFKSKYLSKRNQWVALNARSTNRFSNKKYLAYPINRYIEPLYHAFFTIKDIKIDEEGLALSELLQWLMRSALRNGEDVYLYLPSYRMRKLLINFLNEKSLNDGLYR